MTLKEIYQALIDGKKLRYHIWRPGRYVHLQLNGSCLFNQDGKIAKEAFDCYSNWSIYEEPEDLDKQIQAKTEEVAHCASSGSNIHLAIAISDLIDLRIKKAQLK